MKIKIVHIPIDVEILDNTKFDEAFISMMRAASDELLTADYTSLFSDELMQIKYACNYIKHTSHQYIYFNSDVDSRVMVILDVRVSDHGDSDLELTDFWIEYKNATGAPLSIFIDGTECFSFDDATNILVRRIRKLP